MKTQDLKFSTIIETIYGLPLEDKLEIIDLLEHNIADTRRDEIAENYRKSQEEYKSGKLEFTTNINELKELL